ncbi:MAG: sulfatase-like hydrolase/transferase, partial [Akkermansiaceae bacterium]|nr:sulfatase-like hydrolase/transferase [Akkermansiaceae bacterium]
MKLTTTVLIGLFSTALLPAAKPNFLLLLSDDQDWTGLSVAMHPEIAGSKSAVIQTPNLAKLAGQGMRFSAAYAPSPVCSPTRISIQTGMSPARLHWTKAAPNLDASAGYKLTAPAGRKSIRPEEVTIAELLKTAGYATAHFGKWHISGGGPERHGYDQSDGDTGNRDAAPHKGDNPVDIFGMGRRAATFMEENVSREQPFFIQMSYHALHYPENAKPETLAKYEKLGDGKNAGRAAISEDLDTGVGRLLAKIDELGISEMTYVIYMSDNGGGGGGKRGGRRPLQGGKGSLWEGGIRVPLIIRGPGIEAGSWNHQRVVGFDLLPTLCDLAGVAPDLPEEVEGGSFAPLLDGSSDP